ncbi:MAG: oxidoreductase [Cyanobacteria bacterium P01_A01_bin.116]
MSLSSPPAPVANVVLVTGASSGIGEAITRQLLQDGFTVIAAARNIENMRALEALGAHRLCMDLADEGSIQTAVNGIIATYGGVDILINNAGFGCYGSVEDTPIFDARYQFEVNLFGLARLTQLLLPAMRQKGTGKIINMSSIIGGKLYTPLGAWYHASKHALEGWSDCLRLELSPLGIDVVIVQPGIVHTQVGDSLTGPMLKRSGDGAYAPLANSIAKATHKIDNNSNKTKNSSPAVVANLVSAAVRARRPKTRYAAGKSARLLLWLRKWMGDRTFDRIIMSTIR